MPLVAVGNREGQTFLSTITYVVPVHQAGDIWLVNSPVMHLIRSGERPVIAEPRWELERRLHYLRQAPAALASRSTRRLICSYMSRLERGLENPTVGVQRLSDALDVPIGEFS